MVCLVSYGANRTTCCSTGTAHQSMVCPVHNERRVSAQTCRELHFRRHFTQHLWRHGVSCGQTFQSVTWAPFKNKNCIYLNISIHDELSKILLELRSRARIVFSWISPFMTNFPKYHLNYVQEEGLSRISPWSRRTFTFLQPVLLWMKLSRDFF